MSTIEYRKLFRANICLKVKYKTLKVPKVEGIAFTRNLSSTGVNVILAQKLKEGDELGLEIFLGQEVNLVVAKGTIIWQRLCTYQPKSQKRYYSAGIHFSEMSPDDAIKASDFITDTLRKQKEDEDRIIIEKMEGLR
jgi:c-di-GMP-binding flagellar brake protein YcgR